MRAGLTDKQLAEDGADASARGPVLPYLAELYGRADQHSGSCYAHIGGTYQQIMRAVIQHARET